MRLRAGLTPRLFLVYIQTEHAQNAFNTRSGRWPWAELSPPDNGSWGQQLP
jgi:hypothetical protein